MEDTECENAAAKRRLSKDSDENTSSSADESREKRNQQDSSSISTPEFDAAGDPWNDSLSSPASSGSSTHDTSASAFHYPSFHAWIKNLEAALLSSWDSRNVSTFKYRSVRALLVSWEDDDLGVVKEVDELGQLLSRVYFYPVEKWKIPSQGSWSALDDKVRAVAKELVVTPSLLIFYYAGHARPRGQLGSYPVWTS